MATMQPMPFSNVIRFSCCSMALIGSLLFGMPTTNASDGGLIHIQTPSGLTIHAEIADTPLKRTVGLMYRDHLKKDHGMLFFFSQPQAWSFWMKNTKIALDLIWLDAKKRVTHIERNVPICTKTDDSCPQYRPNSDDAMYVLEIAGGTVDRYRIEKGTTLLFGRP
ncbi:MAG: ACR family protein [Nitrospira sp. LK265]|nr:ACR family protein [Nitrospira sp. LK265]